MKSRNGQGSFWVSYADLMTSLFLLMLVLFAITTYVLVERTRKTEARLKEITSIEQSIRSLPRRYFTYDSTYKRHQLNMQVRFANKSEEILAEYQPALVDVGRVLEDSVQAIRRKYGDRVKFTLLIEGMSSNVPYGTLQCPESKWEDNYTLSYRRALSLVELWNANNVSFDPTYCDVQIAGSGTGGLGRYSGSQERQNQRFLIQILPKVGDLE